MKKNEYFLTAAQAKALDKKAQDKFGMPVLLLMENAGQAVAQAALEILKSRPGKIAVFCGAGNNGGDGFCAARILLAEGFKLQVYLLGKTRDVENEARTNLDILLRLKQRIMEITPEKLGFVKNKIRKSGLIIDALLGVGVSGQIRPLYQRVIDIINASGSYVLSVDIPSGLDATTAKPLGRCVRADKTVTFVAKKQAMAYAQGKKYCGRILVRNIGLSASSLRNF
ncbi:MAG: NAD(P)H-hydrate epimerase [Candidatus Omnitrophica bacterium]|nr:NAD(P)H-hydrate epimerase [Candidatus Omnitrophota bacterium]